MYTDPYATSTSWNPNYQGPPSGLVQFDQSGAQMGGGGMDAAGAFQMAGGIMAIFGAANSAIGTFYQAQSAQESTKGSGSERTVPVADVCHQRSERRV